MKLFLKINNFLFLSLIFILILSDAYADIYKCEDPETGEVIFTNFKGVFQGKNCWIFIKEQKKFSQNTLSFNYYNNNINKKWFEEIGRSLSIDPALLMAIAKVESSFNPKAVSPKGALGLMQLLPTTAELVGIRDPFNPLENLKGGALYLKRLLEEFKDLPLALAAYNAGPEKVRAYGGIPPYPETQQYVKTVLYYYNLYK